MRNEKISNEDILNMIGEMAAKQDDECFAKLEEAADALDIAPDEKILAMARQYDQKKNRKPIKRWISVISKLAAVFVIGVILSLGTVDSSHHITRHGGFIMEEHPESGSVWFTPENEYKDIEELILWWPTYLPKGFEMSFKEESNDEILLVFKSNNDDYVIRIFIGAANDFSFGQDTETAYIKEFDLEECSGYIVFDEINDYSSVFWLTDNEIITIDITSYLSEDELIKLVEGMEMKK